MEVRSHEYILLSMIVRLGEHGSGNYRAVTRFFIHPCGWSWAIHDDNGPPDIVEDLPQWVEENVIMYMYCQTHLQHYALPVGVPALKPQPVDQRILSLLA